MSLLTDERLKLLIDINEIESSALDQIKNALMNPNLVKLVILPDVHTGYDLPIGTAALIQDYISPSAVGYDIGCGMCHVNTGETLAELGLDNKKNREKVFKYIKERIPIGKTSKSYPEKLIEEFPNSCQNDRVNDEIIKKSRLQLGTLGSGNHFIEIGVNSRSEVGITLHSGSRRSGWLIGDHYMKLAKIKGERFGDSYMFPLNSENGQNYFHDMTWAENYALQNRMYMMYELMNLFGLNYREYPITNENHNHAYVDHKNNQILHRKGATPAEKGKLGIIPANQKQGVWITKGLGNKEYLESTSHGAGRRMSRKKATNSLNTDSIKKEMEGIVCTVNKNNKDEAPSAYKNIDGVLEKQSNLVTVIDHFQPIIVVKDS